ncbi:cathepsin F-like isoform X2 [Heterodontus francisci]|uniref:cathepsin F-like isoform X2 n=1 Tax=Heterodontus francisci TaxID=7792 RepID=UPI00355C55F1
MKCLCALCLLLVSLLLRSEGYRCGDGGQCHSEVLDSKQLETAFHDFMKAYNKTYKDQAETIRRFKIFVENMERARKLQEAERGTAKYGVTKFSDLSADDFKSGMLESPDKHLCSPLNSVNGVGKIPDMVDWRKNHSVTPVKDQGDCRSCWAFAVVGNVESQWSIKNKVLISLSDQEVLDCTTAGNCSGGHIDLAFHDVIKLGGLMTEDSYSYAGKVGTCRFKNDKVVAKVKSCVSIAHDETELGTPYWTVKNSWGTNWGEKGYLRVYRGKNTHGIKDFPMSVVV